MRIVEIAVTNLFGVFNHTIPLSLEDRVTIIHGPNGFGKTILLRMLNGLFSRRYSEVLKVPFDKFQITFENGDIVWVGRAKQTVLFEDTSDLREEVLDTTINLSKADSKKVLSISIEPRTQHRRVSSLEIARAIPELTRINSREWFNVRTSQVLSIEEVVAEYGDFFGLTDSGENEWWMEILQSIEIRLIETQRLFKIRESESEPYQRGQRKRLPMRPVVNEFSEELVKIIQQKLAESAALSQSLDRTFPARLVSQIGNANSSQEELRNKLDELETERSRLKEVGLLEKEEDVAFLPLGEIAGATKDVLSVYVEDVEKKLSIFNDIADKIELFIEIINHRFRYKKISISKEEGLTFTTSTGEPLSLAALSSGEQHEVVLLYQLLFKVKPDSLILIDEPELSLHVAWQKQFLRDLQEITKLSSFDVLIATHSPQIIHDRWDLTRELEGPEINEK